MLNTFREIRNDLTQSSQNRSMETWIVVDGCCSDFQEVSKLLWYPNYGNCEQLVRFNYKRIRYQYNDSKVP